MAKHAPSTTPVLRLWLHLSVLHTSSEMALGSLLAVSHFGAVLFLPDLLPSQKGFGFPHKIRPCSLSGYEKGDASVSQWKEHLCLAQPHIPRVSTMMCMGQHRAAQLSMVAQAPILHVAWGYPVTCATTGTSCAPHTCCHQPPSPPDPAICLSHGFQPCGWTLEQHWGW